MKKLFSIHPLLWLVWVILLAGIIAAGWFLARRPPEVAAPLNEPRAQPPAVARSAATSLPPVSPVTASATVNDRRNGDAGRDQKPVPSAPVGHPAPPVAAAPAEGATAANPIPGIPPSEAMLSPEELAALPLPPEVAAGLRNPPPDVIRGLNNPPPELIKGLKTPPPGVGESPFKK